jgi:hypothetical protein
MDDAPKLTPYNMGEYIDMLKARAYLLLMSSEVRSLDGNYAKALFEIVGGTTHADALEAIEAFEATQ